MKNKKERKLFERYGHELFGFVRTTGKMDEHPITGQPGIFFKVEIIGSNPVTHEYVSNNDLKKIK